MSQNYEPFSRDQEAGQNQNPYGIVYASGNAKIHQGDNVVNYFLACQTEEEQDLISRSIYYGSMTLRKRRIHDADDSTCEWIWSTSFARWLRVERLKIFWIRGKPGSGKSTLMKYLSRSPSAGQRLYQSATPWTVIDFFFDFRQAREVGNSMDGLLTTLLRQLRTYIPLVKEMLGRPLATLPSSVKNLQVVLGEALRASDRRFLILIDGLDEYLGEMSPLLSFLKSLRLHKNIKLCLASRPEEAIKQQLSGLPHLDMSTYNRSGIKNYTDLTIDSFQPFLKDSERSAIQEAILARADGVFLWVYLAMSSISKACFRRSPLNEILSVLNALPKEVEAMYQRIVDDIPDDWKSEAAILYTLITSMSNFNPSIALIFSTLKFLVSDVQIASLPRELGQLNLQDFEIWINATLGGLVELVPTSDTLKVEEKHEWTELQVMHETVRAFSEKSKWHEKYLPLDFAEYFPNETWPRLVMRALLSAQHRVEKSNISSITQFYNHHIVYSSFIDILSKHALLTSLVEVAPLLYHSIQLIPHLSRRSVERVDNHFAKQIESAMQSTFAGLHFATGGSYHVAHPMPSVDMLHPTRCDITLAASHSGYRYLEGRKNRIGDLEDEQRNELVSLIIRHSLDYMKTCMGVEREFKSTENEAQLRKSVDMILSFNRSICDFHLNIFVRLGYMDMPQFLLKQLLQGGEAQTCGRGIMYDSPQRPPFASQPPLFVWGCDGVMLPEGEDENPEAQLSILLLFGHDINFRDSSGMNIVHYLISQHIIGHTFLVSTNVLGCNPHDDMCEGIEKLYLVERAGADFSHQYKHRTPLQALRRGIDRILRTPIDQLNLDFEPPEDKLRHLEYMLEHKEQTRHLPQPYIGMQVRTKPSLILPRYCNICATHDQASVGATTVVNVSQHDFVPSRSLHPPLEQLTDISHAPEPEPEPELSPNSGSKSDSSNVGLGSGSVTSPALLNVSHSPQNTTRKTRKPMTDPATTLKSKTAAHTAAVRSSPGTDRLSESFRTVSGPRYLQTTESSRQREKSTQRAGRGNS